MYTSVILVALSGAAAGSIFSAGIPWQTDYAKAIEITKEARKPLAVFVGSGTDGQEKVSKEGKLSPEVIKTLTDGYVCLYVDVTTTTGKKLASDLNIKQSMGLVLSDKTGTLQTFANDGDLSNADMSRWLIYGADPNLAVRTTMSNSTIRTSMYPPTYGSFSGFSTGGFFIGGCPGGT